MIAATTYVPRAGDMVRTHDTGDTARVLSVADAGRGAFGVLLDRPLRGSRFWSSRDLVLVRRP